MKRDDSDFTLFCDLPLLINISEDVDLAYEINHLNNVMANTLETFFNH